MITVEDYLELLVGLKEQSKFQLESSDISFLQSIARQVFKGVALTDRQHLVVKEKLKKYKNQFRALDYNFSDDELDNLRLPLRHIDRSKYIKVVDSTEVFGSNKIYESYKSNWEWIAVRFPFSKKLIVLIEELPKSTKYNYEHEKGSHTHYFKLTESNVFNIIDSFQNKEFDIDSTLLDLYKEISEMKNNKEQYVPGIYNFKLKNLNQKAIDVMISAIGEPTVENLALYKDREDIFGLHHFDEPELDQSIFKLSNLSQKLVRRTKHDVLVNSNTYKFNTLAESLLELNRFPLIVLLNDDYAYEQLSTVHRAFNGFIDNTESTVLFRLDNETNSDFNNYIKRNNLNSTLDKNTKIVYISINKVPKPLIKSDWTPQAMLLMSSIRLNSKVSPLKDQLDLVIHYDTGTSQFARFGNGIEEL